MLFRLREILLSKNIPFNAFAARINMAPSSLAVTDKSLPTLINVQIYADELGMPAWELIYDCGVQALTPYVRPADSSALDDVVVQRVMMLLQEKNMSMRRLAMNMGITAAALTQAFKRKKMGLRIVSDMAAGLGVEPWELLATPDEVRAEVLRRKHEQGIEDEPEPVARFGTLQPVRPVVEAEPEESDFGGEALDLFEQKERAEQQQALTDGEYRYGALIICCRGGLVTVRTA